MGRYATMKVVAPPMPFAKAEGRAKKPLPAEVKLQIVDVLRKGPGSAQEQFERQRTLTAGGGYRNWAPTKPFGTREPGAATLHYSGDYEEAWVGDSGGSLYDIDSEPDQVSIGVDRNQFPQVNIFQRGQPAVLPVSSAMRSALWHLFRVFIRKATITIPQRRIEVGKAAVNRSEAVMRRYYITGVIGGRAL